MPKRSPGKPFSSSKLVEKQKPEEFTGETMDCIFYGFAAIINPLGVLGERLTSLYISHIRLVTFFAFSWHPNLTYYVSKPIEIVAYSIIIINKCVNNKMLKYDWLSTALIYGLIGCFRSKLSDLTCPITNNNSVIRQPKLDS